MEIKKEKRKTWKRGHPQMGHSHLPVHRCPKEKRHFFRKNFSTIFSGLGVYSDDSKKEKKKKKDENNRKKRKTKEKKKHGKTMLKKDNKMEEIKK